MNDSKAFPIYKLGGENERISSSIFTATKRQSLLDMIERFKNSKITPAKPEVNNILVYVATALGLLCTLYLSVITIIVVCTTKQGLV